MRRLLAVVLVLGIPALVACEPDKPTTTPEPSTTPEPTPDEPDVEPEPEAEPEPEPEPAAAEPEVKEVAEAVIKAEGFEARDLHCTLSEPTKNAAPYIMAGLTDPVVDTALDACAPAGAAIDVEWSYVSGQAQNVSVEASSSKLAKCVMSAMQQVRAGLEADCKAVLLIGDAAAATAAYDAR